MTVLVVIGLISGAVILMRPPDTPAAKIIADMMLKETNAAAQSSLLTGETMALGLSETSYGVMRYREGEWQAVDSRRLPETVRLSMEKEGSSVKLSEDIVPLGLFEPTGTATPFTVKISGLDTAYTLNSAGDGRLVMATSP